MSNRLRGVSCPTDVDDVRPKPSCDHRTLTTPMPIRASIDPAPLREAVKTVLEDQAYRRVASDMAAEMLMAEEVVRKS